MWAAGGLRTLKKKKNWSWAFKWHSTSTIVPWINEWINWIFQWFKLKNHQYSRNFRVWEKVEIYHNCWSMSVLWETCSRNLQMTNTPFHVIPAYSEYIYLSESCIAVVEALSWRSRLAIEKLWSIIITRNERVGVSRCLCCLGRDAAGAFASRRPPNETGGWRGSGLCERDHDPHALPPERDHHFHIQTGTLHFCYPLLLPGKLSEISWKVRNSDAPYYMLKLKNKPLCLKAKTPHTFCYKSQQMSDLLCLCVCICEETSVARLVWRGRGEIYASAVLR